MRKRFSKAAALVQRTLAHLSWHCVFHTLETAAISFSVFVGLTFVVFGFRIGSWMHECANFLDHYVAASGAARAPVNLFLLAIYLVLLVLVGLSRREKGMPDGNLT